MHLRGVSSERQQLFCQISGNCYGFGCKQCSIVEIAATMLIEFVRIVITEHFWLVSSVFCCCSSSSSNDGCRTYWWLLLSANQPTSKQVACCRPGRWKIGTLVDVDHIGDCLPYVCSPIEKWTLSSGDVQLKNSLVPLWQSRLPPAQPR